MSINERVKDVVDKVKAKYGSKAIENINNGDVLIQPEATAGGGIGKSGTPFTPQNEDRDNEDDIIIDDDDEPIEGDGREGEGGDKEGGDEEGEAKGKGKGESGKPVSGDAEGEPQGKGKGKGKGSPQGEGGDGEGGDGEGGGEGGDGEGGGEEGGGEEGGGGSGSGEDQVQCQYKVGDIVNIKRTGERAVVTSVVKSNGGCVYQISVLNDSQSYQKMSNGGVVTPPQNAPQGYNEDEIELVEAAIDYDDLLAQMRAMQSYRFKTYAYMDDLCVKEYERVGENISEWRIMHYLLTYRITCHSSVQHYAILKHYQQVRAKKKKVIDISRLPLQYEFSFFTLTNDSLPRPEYKIARIPFDVWQADRFYTFAELEDLLTNPNADPTEKQAALGVLVQALQTFEKYKTWDYEYFKMITMLSISHPDLFDIEKSLLRRLDLIFYVTGQDSISSYIQNERYIFSLYNYLSDFDSIRKLVDDRIEEEDRRIGIITLRKLGDKYFYELLTNGTNIPSIQQSFSVGELVYGDAIFNSMQSDFNNIWSFLYPMRNAQQMTNYKKNMQTLHNYQVLRMKDIIFSLQLKTVSYRR